MHIKYFRTLFVSESFFSSFPFSKNWCFLWSEKYGTSHKHFLFSYKNIIFIQSIKEDYIYHYMHASLIYYYYDSYLFDVFHNICFFRN
uniref:Uncharacterized protein n=1 Tax=Pyxicephalus adspersus TaxID=30357 RepID=A0AAV3AEL5_PYXAD|nr:TPA: hypothetical protein GDO54_014349 [Pyxicephalus adspersus]